MPKLSENILIRSEKVRDIEEIDSLLKVAFPNNSEASLVSALRNQGALTFSLVVEDLNNESILAHLALSLLSVENPGRSWQALALAPLSVLPEFQNQGLGTALIQHWFKEYDDNFFNAVFLLGEPSYYKRFGFHQASEFGFAWENDCPIESFQVRELKKGFLEKASGTVYYHPLFGELT